jgi:hypothetical protein
VSYSSLLEHDLVALEWGYKAEEWDTLDAETKARCIAVVRSKQQIDGVVATYGNKDKPKGRRR